MKLLDLKSLIELANKLIDDGEAVYLHTTIYNNVVLEAFGGSQWTGGEWRKVAETDEDTFFNGLPVRKNKCNRKFVLKDDGSISLTECFGKCIAEIKPGKFVDYTLVCDLKG